MSIFNPFAVGFALVAAGAFVGVDYVTQSRAAGSQPGYYSFATYLESYGLRLDDTVASIDKTRRQSVEARTHLPMEPQGWQRSEWDIASIDMDALTAGMNLVEKMGVKGEMRKALKLANYEAWEYRSGDQMVRISVRFDTEMEPTETAMAGLLTGTFHPIDRPTYSPYTVIGNVPFLAVSDARNADAGSQTLLEARMGDDMIIAVAGDADATAMDGLLAQIDFDSLNQMLTEPLSYVGEGTPTLTNAQKAALAGLHARALNAGTPVLEEMVTAILAGQFVEEVEEQETIVVEVEEPEAKPVLQKPTTTRLQLSGGRTCIGDSGRLCD